MPIKEGQNSALNLWSAEAMAGVGNTLQLARHAGFFQGRMEQLALTDRDDVVLFAVHY